MIRDKASENFIQLTDSTRIKILGDSIAAGRGSSDCAFDGDYIVKSNGRKYYRQTGTRNWGAVLERLLRETHPRLQVVNNACNSMNTHQIHKYIDSLLDPEDDLVLLMMGVNDRKLPGGMYMLAHDLRHIINYIRGLGMEPILLVPNPSTRANEYRGDKVYHMHDVNFCVKEVANRKEVPCISLYDSLMEYIDQHSISLEEFMEPAQELDEYGLPLAESSFCVQDWNRLPDGLHPPDSVQELMARIIIEKMGW